MTLAKQVENLEMKALKMESLLVRIDSTASSGLCSQDLPIPAKECLKHIREICEEMYGVKS